MACECGRLSILDRLRLWRPLGMWSAFSRTPAPTPAQAAEFLLMECRLDLLQAAEEWEKALARYRMLKEREFRLSREVKRLGSTPVLVPPPRIEVKDGDVPPIDPKVA